MIQASLILRFRGLLTRLFGGNVRLELPSSGYIARTARLLFRPDGYALGGVIAIADGVRIGDYAVIAPYGGTIKIGRKVYIGPFSLLYGHGGLEIGDNVLIAGHVTIIPANHGFADGSRSIRSQPSSARGIIIKDDVWIGTGARILDGVTLGAGCVVGAGAVVTKSVPDHAIVAGVPALQIGQRQSPGI